MAAGNQQSGAYSFKFTSFTLTPGPGGSIVIQGNCEGTATGYGTGLGTMTAVGGNSGTVSWCAAIFGKRRASLGCGSGTYEGSGKNRWRTQLVHQLSNGRRVVSDGEIDLPIVHGRGLSRNAYVSSAVIDTARHSLHDPTSAWCGCSTSAPHSVA
jgi:hypothetical protein